jgi:competence protein ComEC
VSGRPLVRLALAWAAGAVLGLSGLPFPAPASAALALVLSPPLAPLAFAAGGWWAASRVRVEAEAAPAHPVDVAGRVVSVPDRLGGRVRFNLRGRDGALLEVLADPTPWPIALGDALRFRAELRAPPGARNPGGRDVAERLRAGGVALQARAIGPVVREAPPSAATWLERARDRLAAAADATLPRREAAVVRAISTGDRGGLDPATTTSFARSGLAHVLAVSGFHLVVVVLGLERLLASALVRCDRLAARADPRRVAAALTLPLAPIYALATGAGAPVLRAAVAASAALAGKLLDRELDALQALALAALALLAWSPASALDPGFQLSFAAVAGLALWATPLRRALPIALARAGTWRARLVEPALEGACATVAASVATAPVLAFHFRQLPLLGIAANVAALPVGAALTAVGALAASAAALAGAAAVPVLWLARPLAWALVALSDAAAAPSWSVAGVGSPGAWGVAAAYGLALLAGRLRGTARALAWAGALAALLAPAPLRAWAARARGGLEVTFVSVGQGDATLLRLPDGTAALVDAGGAPDGGADPGARDLVPLLRDLGVRRLALVVVSHPHPDHVLGLAAVTAAFPVDRVVSNGDPGEGESAEILARLEPAPLRPGDALELGGVRFEAVGGEAGDLAGNDASLVLRVSYGSTAFLFPGDVEEAGEAAAVTRGAPLHADVVKVPHHGSRRSSTAAFAEAVQPRFAVISVGAGNRYRFPHAEALARWTAAGAAIFRTDAGAVRFLSDGRALRAVPAASALDPLATWEERP